MPGNGYAARLTLTVPAGLTGTADSITAVDSKAWLRLAKAAQRDRL